MEATTPATQRMCQSCEFQTLKPYEEPCNTCTQTGSNYKAKSDPVTYAREMCKICAYPRTELCGKCYVTPERPCGVHYKALKVPKGEHEACYFCMKSRENMEKYNKEFCEAPKGVPYSGICGYYNGYWKFECVNYNHMIELLSERKEEPEETEPVPTDGPYVSNKERSCVDCVHFCLHSREFPCSECEGWWDSSSKEHFTLAETHTPEPTNILQVHNNLDLGTAKTSPHYNQFAIQPIEVMEATMTRAEFLGYLKGNMIKYAMRAGKKDAVEKDIAKFNQYRIWHDELSYNPEASIKDLL